MQAISSRKTAVVELLLSKGANIEAANKVMNPNYWSKFLRPYFLDFDVDRDKIMTIFMNTQIIRSAETECFSRLLLMFLFVQYNAYGMREKSPGRTDAWIYYDSLPVRPSVCLTLFFAIAVMCFINELSSFYCSFMFYIRSTSYFIFEYLMIIVWECNNPRLSECAVSWTLHFHPNSIFWYLREAFFSFCYEYQKLTIFPTNYHLFCCLVE